MATLTDILGLIQDTEAALNRFGRNSGADSFSFSDRLVLQSLEKRREALLDQFKNSPERTFLDVCSYRIFPADERSTIQVPALAKSLLDFQGLFTAVFDSLVNGPKERFSADAVILKESTFDFGYTFAGSVGFVLTVEKDTGLFEDSKSPLNRTVRTVFEMARSTNSEQIATFARRLGAAPVRKLYTWAADHVSGRLGAEIRWDRLEDSANSLFVEMGQLESLQRAILETSEEREATNEVVGVLVGLDVARLNFHLQVPGASDITGSISKEVVTNSKTYSVPSAYAASILRKTKINYATEKEDTQDLLLSLRKI